MNSTTSALSPKRQRSINNFAATSISPEIQSTNRSKRYTKSNQYDGLSLQELLTVQKSNNTNADTTTKRTIRTKRLTEAERRRIARDKFKEGMFYVCF